MPRGNDLGNVMSMQRTADAYPRLYHYTTVPGAFGILRTNILWATHCKFLNDYSELVLAKDKLIAALTPSLLQVYRELVSENEHAGKMIAAQGGVDRNVERDAATVVSILYKLTRDEIYLASFCGEHPDQYINANGLLSQWRGYGSDGGIALVFRTRELEELLTKESEMYDNAGTFADVVYSDEDDKFNEELAPDLATIANYTLQLFQDMKSQGKPTTDASLAYPAFIRYIARYKHRGFREENEVRIVAVPTWHSAEYLAGAKSFGETLRPEKERKFRVGRGQLIPYIELFAALGKPLPIERIIVGPHREKEARASALRLMLRNTGINVTVSGIPYVC